jgi:hypothetical protein
LVQQVLVAREYAGLGKGDRGQVRAYVSKVTGLSLPQTTRLIRLYRGTGRVEPKAYRRRRFAKKYTDQDVALLTEVDRAHERLSGPAMRCILNREYAEFGKREYGRLARISVGHLNNLRSRAAYRRQATVFEPTRPSAVSIGERRRPEPRDLPDALQLWHVEQRRKAVDLRRGF